MKTLLLMFIAAGYALCQTVITGTLTLPVSGDLVNGECLYKATRDPFGVPGPMQVLPVAVTVKFGQPEYARGHLEVTLVPTDTAVPGGQYYNVTCTAPAQQVNGHGTQLTTWRWLWLIPTSDTPLELSAVIVPAPGAPPTQMFGAASPLAWDSTTGIIQISGAGLADGRYCTNVLGQTVIGLVSCGQTSTGSGSWGGILGVLTDQTDLIGYLNGKSNVGHVHAEADVTGLVGDMALKAPLASPTFTGTVAGITNGMVGLGNVDNTTDANKPVSTLQQAALDMKASLASPTFTGTVSGITKGMVGLGNVDNTQDTLKPIGNAAQSALDLKAPLASPTFTGSVSGITRIMVGLGNVDNTQDASKPVSSLQQAALDLKASLASPTFSGTVGGITKGMVGLSSVDNTADTAKPVSTAQQTALDAKAGLASPTFTGTVGGITKSMVGLANVDNVADINKAISTLTQSALDLKAPLVSPTFTGTVAGITKGMIGLSSVDNTADVDKPVSSATLTALNLKAPLASPTFTGTIGGITKTMVGLSNVDNTADSTKPVSTAQQTAIDLKANLAGPTFTGTVGGITKGMVGLASVDNTADTTKPVSTIQQAAFDLKANLASPVFTGTIGGITKTMIGLPNVDNTSDAAKPVSSAQQTALDAKAALSHTHAAADTTSGVFSISRLGSSGIGTGTMVLYDDNIWRVPPGSSGGEANTTSNAGTGGIGLPLAKTGQDLPFKSLYPASSKITITDDTVNKRVAFDISVVKSDVGLGSVDNTADVNKPVSTAVTSALTLKADLAGPTFTGTVGGITKAMVGLPSVDNTSDAGKPVSTAQQSALDLKANLVGPTFTGTVAGITKTMVGLGSVDNTADTAKPVSTSQQTALNLKADLAGPTFTGTVAGITKTMVGLGSVDNTADTTKPVSTVQQTALDLKANLAGPTFTGTVGGITRGMVGLGNVDNTADTAKPVSTAQQTALDLKANLANPTFTGAVGGLTKGMVGLGSVDNTADVSKPVSTFQQTALDAKSNLGHTHSAADIASGSFGYARLGTSGLGTGTLVLYDDNVWRTPPGSSGGEANTASNGGTGGVGITLTKAGINLPFKSIYAASSKITVTDDTVNKRVALDVAVAKADVGLSNVDNTADLSKPISTADQAALDLKAPLAGPTFTGTVSGITKAMVGLGSVDNTSDVSKPISTSTQSALDLKSPLSSPTFTGTPAAPTPVVDTNTAQVATAAFVLGQAASANPIMDGSVALGISTRYARQDHVHPTDTTRAPVASPTFTGTVAGVTKAMVGLGNVDNTADTAKPVSTTQQTALDLKANLASPTFTGTVAGVTKAMVGLGSVDNTADTAKPISTTQQTALDLKAPLASPTFTGTVGGVTKSMVGLGSVDNTADTAKPISTSQQTALDAKLPYTGAVTDVDLGTHKVTAASFATTASTSAGYHAMPQGVAVTPPVNTTGFEAPTSVPSSFLNTLWSAPTTGFVRASSTPPYQMTVAAIANSELPTAGLSGLLKYTAGVPTAIGTSATNCVHEDGSSGACGSGGALPTDSSNKILATPADGSSGVVAARKAVPADLPSEYLLTATSASGTGYSGTLPSGVTITAYVTGETYIMIADVANTGTATATFGAAGTRTIKKVQGGVTTNLVANDIRAGQIVVLRADATNFQMLSQLGNAPAGSGTVNSGTNGQMAYYGADGTVISGKSLTMSDLPTAARIWSCQPGLGDGLTAITAGTYLQSMCYNDTGVTVTLTGIKCFSDNGGTSTMNVSDSSSTALLTGAVTCGTTFAAATQSAAVTVANGSWLKFTFVSDGATKQTTWVITGTK